MSTKINKRLKLIELKILRIENFANQIALYTQFFKFEGEAEKLHKKLCREIRKLGSK